MPRMCTICGKTYSKTIKRSHSMRASIRRLMPNTQWTRDDSGNRVKACTRCIKSKTKTHQGGQAKARAKAAKVTA